MSAGIAFPTGIDTRMEKSLARVVLKNICAFETVSGYDIFLRYGNCGGCPSFQFLLEKVCYLSEQVVSRVPSVYPMVAVGVENFPEILVGLYKGFGILV